MNFKKKFPEEALERIRRSVKEAEKEISGEIVPVIVERSGTYVEAVYKAAMMFGLLCFLLIIVFDRYILDPNTVHTFFYDPLFIFLAVVVAGGIGAALAAFSDGVKRMFISRQEMDQQTRQRAGNVFLEEEVFNTRHRTGIMIFISMFEHEVVVMADRGINKVVDQNEWDDMVRDLVGHIRRGAFVEGIQTEIKRCADILLEKGFKRTPDDVNELRDDLRIN